LGWGARCRFDGCGAGGAPSDEMHACCCAPCAGRPSKPAHNCSPRPQGPLGRQIQSCGGRAAAAEGLATTQRSAARRGGGGGGGSARAGPLGGAAVMPRRARRGGAGILWCIEAPKPKAPPCSSYRRLLAPLPAPPGHLGAERAPPAALRRGPRSGHEVKAQPLRTSQPRNGRRLCVSRAPSLLLRPRLLWLLPQRGRLVLPAVLHGAWAASAQRRALWAA
jgi:hypothetical protein